MGMDHLLQLTECTFLFGKVITAISRASKSPEVQKKSVLPNGQGTICELNDVDEESVGQLSVSAWGIVEKYGVFRLVARRTCNRQPSGKHGEHPDEEIGDRVNVPYVSFSHPLLFFAHPQSASLLNPDQVVAIRRYIEAEIESPPRNAE